MFQKMRSLIRVSIRLPLMLVWTLSMFIICALAINIRLRTLIERTYWHGVLLLLGIKVQYNKKIKDRGVVIVANHMSYTDIMVLHALFKGYFVAKTEVKNWPIYGWAASLIQTLFVERDKKGSMNNLIKEGSKRLNNRENIIIFPEGTTVEHPVGDFKKGAFALAKHNNSPIIPVVLKYNHPERVAWIGDMTFLDHLIKFMAIAAKDEVQVTVLPKMHTLLYQDEDDIMNRIHHAMQKIYDTPVEKLDISLADEIFEIEGEDKEYDPAYSRS